MSALGDPILPAPQRLAVAYTPPAARPPLAALLAFDFHLGRVVTGAREPTLGQIRLAWWRGELAEPVGERVSGNPQLTGLGKHWRGEEGALTALVDGWERLLGAAPLPDDDIASFVEGRSATFAAFARLVGSHLSAGDTGLAGRRWALADLAERTSDARERDACLSLFGKTRRPARLPRALRGVAVLEGLATRAMARREPLMTGRGGALAALRLGLLGR